MNDDELIAEIQRQYRERGGDVEAIKLPLQKLKEKNMLFTDTANTVLLSLNKHRKKGGNQHALGSAIAAAINHDKFDAESVALISDTLQTSARLGNTDIERRTFLQLLPAIEHHRIDIANFKEYLRRLLQHRQARKDHLQLADSMNKAIDELTTPHDEAYGKAIIETFFQLLKTHYEQEGDQHELAHAIKTEPPADKVTESARLAGLLKTAVAEIHDRHKKPHEEMARLRKKLAVPGAAPREELMPYFKRRYGL